MDWTPLGTIVAFILTLMVGSYIFGDTFVFKIAEHILVGVSVGWAVLQIVYNLLVPAVKTLVDGFSGRGGISGEMIAVAVPLVLGLILLLRSQKAAKPLTNPVMGLVVGTVAALSLAGALTGTLLPQVGATMVDLKSGDVIGKVVLVVGTVLSLWYFHFTVFKAKPTEGRSPAGVQTVAMVSDRVRLVGRWSLMLAFGAVFASVFLTYFAALMDRVLFFVNNINVFK